MRMKKNKMTVMMAHIMGDTTHDRKIGSMPA